MSRLTNSFPMTYYTKLIITDSMGNILTQKYYNAPGDLNIYSILPAVNGDILFVGYAEYFSFPIKEDVYALRTDSLLNAPPPIGIYQVNEIIPITFSLYQNYPNPFNPETQIKFDVPKTSNIKIVVYDILGREVAIIVNGKMDPGVYNASWNATPYASGVYFYRLEADGYIDTKKMVLLK
ncbi:MAG: T9SS type A sorting domain-containing protein [Ignavibacteria bacterium]|nr:T9SS type A sorting domain-containing protein [Ignavibacteria bacterium]